MAGNFRQEFNFIAFVKAIFDQMKFLTNFFHKNASAGLEVLMNVKINFTQKTKAIDYSYPNKKKFSERQPTFDKNKLLTNCLAVAFDEIFR